VKILYLAVGVFDKGGISRYCRYQVRALREYAGPENVHVLSLVPPSENDFEEPFQVDRAFRGFGLRSEVDFLLAGVGVARSLRPDVIWSSHIRFLPNGLLGRWCSGAALAANIYGEEAWSGKLLPLHKRTLLRADLVISDCHFTADFISDEYKIQSSHLAVVWDCVDLKKFEPRARNQELLRHFKLPAGPEQRYLMTLGRIEARSRYKGYDRLLDAVGALRHRSNISLLYVGTGDDVERLRERAAREGLSDRVFFLGSVPENMLCDVYNLCDAFALVSDRGPGRGEGIPLTPLEAAACGKPIIVGDEDGSREAVVKDLNGFCISPRDPEALRRAIETLMLDDSLRLRMGVAARARAESEFSYESFRSKTEVLADRLAQTARDRER
jgi:phosphatidylinositol alpha-1,6-mannosyltransferase